MHYSELPQTRGRSDVGFKQLLAESELDWADDLRRMGLEGLAESVEARAAEEFTESAAGGEDDAALRESLAEGFRELGLDDEAARDAANIRRPWEGPACPVREAPDEAQIARGKVALEAAAKACARAHGKTETDAREIVEQRIREDFAGRPFSEAVTFLERYAAKLTAEAPAASSFAESAGKADKSPLEYFDEVLRQARAQLEVTGR